MSFKTPILLITFNRLDTTKRVFERIKEQQPKYLFIASDGPRENRLDDIVKIEEVRSYILSNIDWVCEVKTLFREKNLGCGVAPYTAITWFFECVEHGIILEDDCLPYPDFFNFCETILNKYKQDETIWEISGTNLQKGIKRGDGSYYFSNYGGIWGWATWARAWKHYDYSMKNYGDFLKNQQIKKIFSDKQQQKYWHKTLNNASKLGTWWDYQWLYTFWSYGGKCIVPNVNLIENIGFNGGGTHTMSEPKWYKSLTLGNGIIGEIKHPNILEVNTEADDFFYKKCTATDPLLIRLINRLKRIFN